MAVTYPTTGTVAFNLNVNEAVEEAFERCGAELRSGYDMRTARRSLNLMFLDWSNRGLNLWTLDSNTIPFVAGTLNYALPADTVDLLDHVIRTGAGVNQADITISRISESTYSTIPNKLSPGRPLQVWIDRQGGAVSQGTTQAVPQINVWPVPDANGVYTFVYWRLRRMQDPGNGYNGMDVPFRFLPVLVAGLSYYLSRKIPGARQYMADLKEDYDSAWQIASEEDREKAPLRLVPRISQIHR